MKQQTPLEATISKSIVSRCNAELKQCKLKKYHGEMFGSAELDIYGCYQGKAVFIETKRPGQKPTPRQASLIRQWKEVGAICGWVTSAEEALNLLKQSTQEHTHDVD